MNKELFTYLNPRPEAGTGGPLDGMKICAPPNLAVKGWLTDAGSRALEGYMALEDATAIERLRENGAVLVGSSRMSELGFGLTGDTASRIMAEESCDALLLADTLGEARVAAATAGVLGFKPSYGICSRFGLNGLIPSMECPSVLTRSPELAARIMAALSGSDDRDFSMRAEGFPDFGTIAPRTQEKPVLGTIREALDLLEASDRKAFESSAESVRKKGMEIRETSLKEFELFRTVHHVIGSVEASSSAGRYDSVRYGHRASGADNWNEMYLRSRMESFGTLVKSYLFQGAFYQFREYETFRNACRIRRRLVEETAALFKTVDFLLLPTRASGPEAAEARTIAEVYDAFAYTLPANGTGLPSVSIPGLVKSGEKDLGLQIVGPSLGDAGVLGVAGLLLDSKKGNR